MTHLRELREQLLEAVVVYVEARQQALIQSEKDELVASLGKAIGQYLDFAGRPPSPLEPLWR